ncbi:MAG: aldehyde dehydrogenase family protein, partial [Roseovarius sp.]|nr:aldehyde dehydrogenase family protein [Roseovarius sp.]
NTVVLKPSEKDPSVPVRLAELMMEAGAPEGVLNVVHGDKEAVDTLLEHPDVKAISFVGSTAIAKYVYARGAANGKRVQAMGGAKNHMIILPDADLDLVTDALIGSAYGSAGERCMANPVAVPVGDELADAIIERLVPRIKELKIGPSLDPAMEMGPLVTAEHRARVR